MSWSLTLPLKNLLRSGRLLVWIRPTYINSYYTVKLYILLIIYLFYLIFPQRPVLSGEPHRKKLALEAHNIIYVIIRIWSYYIIIAYWRYIAFMNSIQKVRWKPCVCDSCECV